MRNNRNNPTEATMPEVVQYSSAITHEEFTCDQTVTMQCSSDAEATIRILQQQLQTESAQRRLAEKSRQQVEEAFNARQQQLEVRCTQTQTQVLGLTQDNHKLVQVFQCIPDAIRGLLDWNIVAQDCGWYQQDIAQSLTPTLSDIHQAVANIVSAQVTEHQKHQQREMVGGLCAVSPVPDTEDTVTPNGKGNRLETSTYEQWMTEKRHLLVELVERNERIAHLQEALETRTLDWIANDTNLSEAKRTIVTLQKKLKKQHHHQQQQQQQGPETPPQHSHDTSSSGSSATASSPSDVELNQLFDRSLILNQEAETRRSLRVSFSPTPSPTEDEQKNVAISQQYNLEDLLQTIQNLQAEVSTVNEAKKELVRANGRIAMLAVTIDSLQQQKIQQQQLQQQELQDRDTIISLLENSRSSLENTLSCREGELQELKEELSVATQSIMNWSTSTTPLCPSTSHYHTQLHYHPHSDSTTTLSEHQHTLSSLPIINHTLQPINHDLSPSSAATTTSTNDDLVHSPYQGDSGYSSAATTPHSHPPTIGRNSGGGGAMASPTSASSSSTSEPNSRVVRLRSEKKQLREAFETATLRWVAMDNHIVDLQTQLNAKETECDQLKCEVSDQADVIVSLKQSLPPKRPQEGEDASNTIPKQMRDVGTCTEQPTEVNSDQDQQQQQQAHQPQHQQQEKIAQLEEHVGQLRQQLYDYRDTLRDTNARMHDTVKDNEELSTENRRLESELGNQMIQIAKHVTDNNSLKLNLDHITRQANLLMQHMDHLNLPTFKALCNTTTTNTTGNITTGNTATTTGNTSREQNTTTDHSESLSPRNLPSQLADISNISSECLLSPSNVQVDVEIEATTTTTTPLTPPNNSLVSSLPPPRSPMSNIAHQSLLALLKHNEEEMDILNNKTAQLEGMNNELKAQLEALRADKMQLQVENDKLEQNLHKVSIDHAKATCELQETQALLMYSDDELAKANSLYSTEKEGREEAERTTRLSRSESANLRYQLQLHREQLSIIQNKVSNLNTESPSSMDKAKCGEATVDDETSTHNKKPPAEQQQPLYSPLPSQTSLSPRLLTEESDNSSMLPSPPPCETSGGESQYSPSSNEPDTVDNAVAAQYSNNRYIAIINEKIGVLQRDLELERLYREQELEKRQVIEQQYNSAIANWEKIADDKDVQIKDLIAKCTKADSEAEGSNLLSTPRSNVMCENIVATLEEERTKMKTKETEFMDRLHVIQTQKEEADKQCAELLLTLQKEQQAHHEVVSRLKEDMQLLQERLLEQDAEIWRCEDESDSQQSEIDQENLHRKNEVLEHLSRKHEDALHMLETKFILNYAKGSNNNNNSTNTTPKTSPSKSTTSSQTSPTAAPHSETEDGNRNTQEADKQQSEGSSGDPIVSPFSITTLSPLSSPTPTTLTQTPPRETSLNESYQEEGEEAMCASCALLERRLVEEEQTFEDKCNDMNDEVHALRNLIHVKESSFNQLRVKYQDLVLASERTTEERDQAIQERDTLLDNRTQIVQLTAELQQHKETVATQQQLIDSLQQPTTHTDIPTVPTSTEPIIGCKRCEQLMKLLDSERNSRSQDRYKFREKINELENTIQDKDLQIGSFHHDKAKLDFRKAVESSEEAQNTSTDTLTVLLEERDDNIKSLQRECDTLQSELSELTHVRNTYKKANTQLMELTTVNETMRQELCQVQEEREAAADQLGELRGQLEVSTQMREDMSNALEQLKEELSESNKTHDELVEKVDVLEKANVDLKQAMENSRSKQITLEKMQQEVEIERKQRDDEMNNRLELEKKHDNVVQQVQHWKQEAERLGHENTHLQEELAQKHERIVQLEEEYSDSQNETLHQNSQLECELECVRSELLDWKHHFSVEKAQCQDEITARKAIENDFKKKLAIIARLECDEADYRNSINQHLNDVQAIKCELIDTKYLLSSERENLQNERNERMALQSKLDAIHLFDIGTADNNDDGLLLTKYREKVIQLERQLAKKQNELQQYMQQMINDKAFVAELKDKCCLLESQFDQKCIQLSDLQQRQQGTDGTNTTATGHSATNTTPRVHLQGQKERRQRRTTTTSVESTINVGLDTPTKMSQQVQQPQQPQQPHQQQQFHHQSGVSSQGNSPVHVSTEVDVNITHNTRSTDDPAVALQHLLDDSVISQILNKSMNDHGGGDTSSPVLPTQGSGASGHNSVGSGGSSSSALQTKEQYDAHIKSLEQYVVKIAQSYAEYQEYGVTCQQALERQQQYIDQIEIENRRLQLLIQDLKRKLTANSTVLTDVSPNSEVYERDNRQPLADCNRYPADHLVVDPCNTTTELSTTTTTADTNTPDYHDNSFNSGKENSFYSTKHYNNPTKPKKKSTTSSTATGNSGKSCNKDDQIRNNTRGKIGGIHQQQPLRRGSHTTTNTTSTTLTEYSGNTGNTSLKTSGTYGGGSVTDWTNPTTTTTTGGGGSSSSIDPNGTYLWAQLRTLHNALPPESDASHIIDGILLRLGDEQPLFAPSLVEHTLPHLLDQTRDLSPRHEPSVHIRGHKPRKCRSAHATPTSSSSTTSVPSLQTIQNVLSAVNAPSIQGSRNRWWWTEHQRPLSVVSVDHVGKKRHSSHGAGFGYFL